MIERTQKAAERSIEDFMRLLELLGESSREIVKKMDELAESVAEIKENRQLLVRVTRASNTRSRRLGLLEWYTSGFE